MRSRRLLRELSQLLLVLWLLSLFVFALGYLMPGDIATVVAGDSANPAELEELRRELGLDRPLWSQYVGWIGGAVQGDFGVSPIDSRPVAETISSQLPVSVQLGLQALVVAVLVGMSLGILAAIRANSGWDTLIRSWVLLFFSVPPFVVGVGLLLVGALYLPELYSATYVPISENAAGNLRSMLLPTIAVATPATAMITQLTRTTMLEALAEPHIEIAIAKGAPMRNVYLVHALKNAAKEIATLIGLLFGALISGSIIVEEIFSLPGLGRGLVGAIGRRDFPLAAAITLIAGTGVVVANKLVDIAYPILDPRQRVA